MVSPPIVHSENRNLSRACHRTATERAQPHPSVLDEAPLRREHFAVIKTTMWRRWIVAVWLMVFAVPGSGCGGGGGDGGGTACQQVGEATCMRACACTEGPGCALNDNGLSLTFEDEADCRGFLVTFACSGGNQAYADAAACLPLVQAAMCTGTGTEAAVSWPMAPACVTPE